MALIIEETRLLFHYLIIRGIVLNGTIINISIIITQQQGSRTVKEVFLRLVYKPFFFVVSTHWVRSTHPRKSNPTRKSLVALRSSKIKEKQSQFFQNINHAFISTHSPTQIRKRIPFLANNRKARW